MSPIPDTTSGGADAEGQSLRAEIARLNKIIRALMNRAEASTSLHGSEYGLFQTTVMLREEVRHRTEDLEAALRENERINRSLRESESRFHGLVNQSLVGIAIIEDGRFSYTNLKFDAIFGYNAEEIRLLGPLDVAFEDDRPLVAEQIRRRLSGDVEGVAYVFRGLRKDGSVVDIEVQGSGMKMGGRLALISLVEDVTERTRAEREVRVLQSRLREEAIRDPLTDLFNRRYLDETLGRELARANRYGRPISLIMADLDHFKAVNDTYGHPSGDEVLRAFGGLIKGRVRSSDIPCRYGGEEFLLILPDMSYELAAQRAEQLRVALEGARIGCDGRVIQVTASFGVAAFPEDGKCGGELIAAADGALYAAKAAGRNQVKTSSGLREPHL
ncbi:MAG: GGDEF domain-containing protein [Deltaproteobacteria bacterium]|nr:GGDEF domain-containing protein [Deltaproteobacteria bacterium]